MESKKYTSCGGCGAEKPIDRCIGCFHPFEPFFRNEYIEWVNLADNYTEDWQIMHCRYASDGRKLDTELFEEKDNGLVKVGGTGRLEYKEVEYMVILPAPQAQPCAVWVKAETPPPAKRWHGKVRTVNRMGALNERQASWFPGWEVEGPCDEYVSEWLDESGTVANELPTFWDVAKAFKWATEYNNELGETLVLTEDGQWLLLKEDEGITTTDELTSGNVAELYCLQKGFNKDADESAAGREEAVAFAEWISEQGYWPPSKDQWMKSHFENNKTTAQLYELFKQQKEK